MQIARLVVQVATHWGIGRTAQNPATPAREGASAIPPVSAHELPREAYAIPLPRGVAMDLTTWLPAMLLLGLIAVGLMFLFVEACDKV